MVLNETPIQLTSAQEAVVSMALEGHNIFLSGAAGSGSKICTLKEILRRLNSKYNGESKHPGVQVVAPTGIAVRIHHVEWRKRTECPGPSEPLARGQRVPFIYNLSFL